MNKKYFSIFFSLLVVFSFVVPVWAADESLIRNNLLQTIINLLIKGGKAELSEPMTVTCTDSDNGKSYFVSGSTRHGPIEGNYYDATDGCDVEGKTLSEFYCDGNYSTVAYYQCPNGCRNGACITESINGVCGTASKTYSIEVVSYSINTFCASGTVSPASPAFPAQGTSVSWTCVGVNGGSSSACTASRSKDYSQFKAREIVEDNLPTSITFWTEASCPTASAFPYVVPTGYRVESCESGSVGSHGGCSYCAMSKIKLVAGVNSINGVCGSANRTTVSSIPAFNLCSSGTASAVIGSGPWTWTCAGINGGTTATCSTNIINDQNSVINILSPKAGESLQQGSVYTVSYTSSGYESGEDFSVYLSGNNNLYRPIGTLYIGKTFNFTVPTDLSGSGFQIDIAGEDISDVFSIVKQPISSNYSQFKAREIVEDNLPTSITFWTEAYCPNSSTFPYVVPNGYKTESCVSGLVGSHGGCSYCAMSKIKLVQSSIINNTCIGENQSISVTPTGFTQSCCIGLSLCPPASGIVGSRGTCKKSCDTSINNPTSLPNVPNPDKPLNQMNRDELINYLIKIILILLGDKYVPTTTNTTL